eukprot:1160241-Pelagomonas_calceolata.AAC.5
MAHQTGETQVGTAVDVWSTEWSTSFKAIPQHSQIKKALEGVPEVVKTVKHLQALPHHKKQNHYLWHA